MGPLKSNVYANLDVAEKTVTKKLGSITKDGSCLARSKKNLGVYLFFECRRGTRGGKLMTG